MERNLYNRVETCFPVTAKKLLQRVKNDLETYLLDNCQSWQLQSDGGYLSFLANREPEAEEVSAQETLLDAYAQQS
jgi:polyphosphate kinase